jgi:ribonuclease-3 family protein
MNSFPEIKNPISVKRALSMNALVLAFVGDAAETLSVRSRLASESDFKAGKLHELTASAVNAKALAAEAERIFKKLNEDELAVFMRARNGKAKNPAKNAALAEYRMATALEAVIGFLYLTGQSRRLEELFSI